MKHFNFFIIGPSGCGKTFISSALSEKYDLLLIEADNYHSKRSIKKMKRGISLKTNDRILWLNKIKKSTSINKNCIISCSLIKSTYRNLVSSKSKENIFIYPCCSMRDIIKKSLSRNHFFNTKLTSYQFYNFQSSNNVIKIRYDFKKNGFNKIENILKGEILKSVK